MNDTKTAIFWSKGLKKHEFNNNNNNLKSSYQLYSRKS